MNLNNNVIADTVLRYYASVSESFKFDDDSDFDDTDEVVGQLSEPYEMVDLKLPSNTLWAKWNLGASSKNPYGDYYMWGQVEPAGDNECSADTQPYSVEGHPSKYNSTDGVRTLLAEDDPCIKLCDMWRMPTLDDFMELRNNCTCDDVNDYAGLGPGRVFTSNIDKTARLFFPYAGYKDSYGVHEQGVSFNVWSSSISDDMDCMADYLYADNTGLSMYGCLRYYGNSVRPVCHANLQ